MTEKVAIIARPCDLGSVVALVAEGKISRNDVYIIGVGCSGVVDPPKLEKAICSIGSGSSIDEAEKAYLDGDMVVVDFSNDETKRVPFADVMLDECGSCKSDLSFADVSIGESLVSAVSGEAVSTVPEDADAAWWRTFWVKEFDRCLRCYACREACPACYCRDNCAVQALRERWLGSTMNSGEAMMFHAQRAMHVAGRCTECGACERACPVGIPLLLLHNQVGKAVRKLFDFNVGEKAEKRPPLEIFQKEEL
jgi:ferredoxin